MKRKQLCIIKHLLLLLVTVSMVSNTAFATHNRAGEITYTHVTGTQFTYDAIIVTYTKINPPAPDRPELEIFWGDGDHDTISRVSVIPVAPDIKRNEYHGRHTYQGTGVYTIFFIDEFRNAGVKNIGSGNSDNVPFYVETQLTINSLLNFMGIYNNTPVLLEPPIDEGVVNRTFIHNPSAYDPDGDSLSYEITDCKGYGGATVPGYFLPIIPPQSLITLNPVTGDFVWETPQEVGIFNFAIKIFEWKNVPGYGMMNIGYVSRDFQVNITATNNLPPQIAAHDTCVEAGATLAFDVTATEPDNETVTISATGGPFQIPFSPALPDSTNVSGVGSAIYNFIWSTQCAHVRKAPYQVVFKAVDNNPNVQLTDISSMSILVVGPAPKNPAAQAKGDSITVNWNPGTCSNTSGYYIYRRVNVSNYTPGYCVTGVPSQTGYVRIGTLTGINDTLFNDSNNGQGLATAVEYCYMITARFPDGAEGYPSTEVCAHLKRDLPVITNADILNTSTTSGNIYLAWSPPVELDTTQYPGPFSYTLQRRISSSSVFTDVITLGNWNDTTWTDVNLDTKNQQYIYRVLFNYSGGIFLGKSQEASSVFLTALPGDNKVRLSWNFNVPWTNDKYYIYRSETGNPFILLDSIAQPFYTDYSALNTINYCYYIESSGGYAQSGIVFPILNKSQEDCATPFDNEAPCPVVISTTADCDSSTVDFTWIYGNTPDCITTDIDYFTIYFASASNQQFDSVGTFQTTDQFYSFQRGLFIGGCYYITATDTNGNVTDSSNSVCIESCPVYILPNLFTPDGNNINDYFTPVEQTLTGLLFRDISSVDIKIYNRWGDLIFTTTDPVIRWNGKRNNDGEDVPEGTYFYTCLVYTTNMAPEQEPLQLHGTIQVARSSVRQ
ncbi:MAG: gliding motility-associated C-terminal domain-containing protein [Bacteroidota bacterium]